MVIVLMEPAGIGDTTVGRALAEHLGWRFVEADAHASAEGGGTLSAGMPSTHADRPGWLHNLHALAAQALGRRESLVLSCPILTDAERQALADGLRPVRFVRLAMGREEEGAHASGAPVLDGTSALDTLIAKVRLEFGV